jgi:hypothetical protein
MNTFASVPAPDISPVRTITLYLICAFVVAGFGASTIFVGSAGFGDSAGLGGSTVLVAVLEGSVGFGLAASTGFGDSTGLVAVLVLAGGGS